jgi:hypothetical protein
VTHSSVLGSMNCSGSQLNLYLNGTPRRSLNNAVVELWVSLRHESTQTPVPCTTYLGGRHSSLHIFCVLVLLSTEVMVHAEIHFLSKSDTSLSSVYC